MTRRRRSVFEKESQPVKGNGIPAKTTIVNAGTQNIGSRFMDLNDEDNNGDIDENIQVKDDKNNDDIDVNNHVINDSNMSSQF